MSPALLMSMILGAVLLIAGAMVHDGAGNKIGAYAIWAVAAAMLSPSLFWLWMLAFGGMLGR